MPLPRNAILSGKGAKQGRAGLPPLPQQSQTAALGLGPAARLRALLTALLQIAGANASVRSI